MTAAPQGQRDLGSLVFTAFLWLVACGVLIGALGFRYPANLAPVMLGGAAVALLSVLLIREIARFIRGNRPADSVPATPEVAPPPVVRSDLSPEFAQTSSEHAIDAATSPGLVGTILPDTDPAAAQHEKAALLWTIGSIGLLLMLGFLVGMTVAMLGLLRVYGRESWLMSVVATTFVMVTLYVAFGVFLRIAFFPGLVPDLLGLG